MRAFALTLLTSTAVLAQQPVRPPAPDTLYIHGDIFTGAHLLTSDTSPTAARVSALAVSHGSITAAGSDADILKLKTPQTRVIDLHGAFAMPGFNDAHTHMAAAGRQKLTVDLDGTASLADMLSRIRAYVATAPAGSWIVGSGWDHTKWPSATLPTRADLDSVTGAHPAMFTRTDGHIVVANSAALKAANITANTPSPQGGKIDHDANGALTGIVREGPAIALLSAHIPPPSRDERRRALEIAIADALSHGVTSVQDFSEWEDFLVLESLERGHKLHLRVSEWLDFNLPLKTLEERRASHDPADPLLHIGQLKAYMDGSLGSRTAALAAPYSDDPTNSGITRYNQARLNGMSAERAAAGFQLGFHAIGDQANHMALDAFTAAEQVASSKDPRFRIEHAQVLLPADFDRFARFHVIASMQPVHLLSDMNWAAARLGPDRARYSYAWRSMLNHHINLAFGTDYPVESINPFRGLYAAITRQNEAGTATYQPQEKLTLPEAIYAYTQASAYAEFRERIKGRLEPGFLADIVVLDRDPFKSNPQQLLHIRVLRTIVNGETVYEAP
ncbi:MAG TPA: amidohydrolase [Acidobacteriaceae bacterium]|nr:amidohydrolase [Acidobacteriaceae bacterium]